MPIHKATLLEAVTDESEARRPDAVVPPEQDDRVKNVVVRIECALLEEDTRGSDKLDGSADTDDVEERVGEGEVVVAPGFR